MEIEACYIKIKTVRDGRTIYKLVETDMKELVKNYIFFQSLPGIPNTLQLQFLVALTEEQ